MTKNIDKKLLSYIFIFISLVLIVAFIIEYSLDQKPCRLCIYERIPYFIALLMIAKIFLIKGNEKITLLLLSLLFCIGSILAFYHFGIEQGFINESSVCASKNLSETLTKDQLLEQLKEDTVSCKEVGFKVLGFSLATINTIFSICLSVIFIRLFINYGKN